MKSKDTDVINAKPTLQDSFTELNKQLNEWLIERSHEINATINALIAKRHVYMLGSPGVGKSFLIDLLLDMIDGSKVFKINMTRFTTPPEVFGPMSLKAMEEDRQLRKIEGYLPTAHLALLDEGFKASSSILNSLLWALNERRYRHDDTVIDIPLHTLFVASNELPQSEELNALYDRLDVRLVVNPIRDNSNFKKMLALPRTPVSPVLTWAEVQQAHEEAMEVEIPSEVLDGITELRRVLKVEEGIEPTERHFRSSLDLVRAAAWLDGCQKADLEHLRPLQDALWDKPEQYPQINKRVLAIASPLDMECNELLLEIDKLEQRLDAISKDPDRASKGNDIYTKLTRAKDDLEDIKKKAGNSRHRSLIIGEVRSRLYSVTNRAIRELFNLDPADLEK